MISAASRPYIDASVPVLREHGVAITTTFYRNMFAEHPELTNLFNMGNQATGAQQQSLASAVFAYAANIGDPGALAPVIERIVHKHVSVGIRAEHYPIVGRHLLGAIASTLGEAATPPLLAAWDEAYHSLAALFIEAERALYAEAGITPGQRRAMRVTEVRQESADVVSIRMTPEDGAPVAIGKPGQYLSVQVDFADGHRQIRQYSLSDTTQPGRARVSVKRAPAGAGTPAGEVSNWIHENVRVGSVLQVSPPFGDFAPECESDEPVVLLSAGIGITPMIAALKRIAQVHPRRHVIFAHAARNAQHHAHQLDVAAARSVMPNLQVVTFYEEVSAHDDAVLTGWMDVTYLPAWPRQETNVYMCGPLPFMQAQWLALVGAGVPVERLHREVFGPDLLDHLL
ncbi:globin domain-containing protein [Massilia pseudoviolaceinigra]|uniref:globin domain-containing protein n=1 Tax=Massilia pseudoviolaceinigra TaxID=3057165 RepID=UPI0027967FE3|nr:globin domain-containing protein [Massilia sp. CCM 9206]MDQ1922739.1 globin domain-containing protein [Massilia sp. CCM 9206]